MQRDYLIKVQIIIISSFLLKETKTTNFFFFFFIVLGVDKDGKGLLYRNIFDCFIKTYKIEGMRGLYKGFVANYLRCAPHTILNLTFWDLFKEWKDIYLSEEANMYFE